MSGSVPAWVERLLGIQTGPGEGTVWRLQYAWGWPPWATLLLIVLAVAFVVAIYLREGHRASRAYRLSLAGLRLAIMLLVAVMIAQVSVLIQRTGLPYVAVLIDDSRSMSVVDRYDPKTLASLQKRLVQALGPTAEPNRWNAARAILAEDDGRLLRTIAANHNLRLYRLTGARSVEGVESAAMLEELAARGPEGEQTRLGAAVRAVLDDLRGAAPAGMVILSDGINTDGPPLVEAAMLARRRGVPLFLVGLGSEEPIRDLTLTDLLVDDVVFLGDVVHFEAKLAATGLSGEDIRVVLRDKDKGEILAGVDVTVGPEGQTQTVRIPYRPTEVGKLRCVVEATPQPGEQQTDNNRQERVVEVRKEQIRVLLVAGYPNYEFRFLRNLLQRDETVELNTVLQEADPEYAEQDAAALRVFPVSREELFAYDVVILDDANPALLSGSMLQNLAEFVDQPAKGGSLVLIAGPRHLPEGYRETPLAALMPVALEAVLRLPADDSGNQVFTLRPTELGLRSPGMQLGDTPAETRAVWDKLPPLLWHVEFPEVKPGARVLAEHPERRGPDGRPIPLVILHYVGAGKVLMHAVDGTWRWRRRVGDVFFARYWIQTLRQLSRAKLSGAGRAAVLSTARTEYERGEPVLLRVRFADERLAPTEDDGVTVVLERPGHKSQRLKLARVSGRGTFETVLSNLVAGDYHAWLAIPTLEGRAPAVDFKVAAPRGESDQTRPDMAAMRLAAKQTGGEFYTFDTADHLAGDLPRGRQVPVETLPPKPLWNRWPLLLLFLGLLVSEWILRKRGGMV